MAHENLALWVWFLILNGTFKMLMSSNGFGQETHSVNCNGACCEDLSNHEG